jgi:hypothetical protein
VAQRLRAIGVLVVLLAGCVSPEEQASMDRQRCVGFGFAPGSDSFANCMMQTSQQRQAEQAASQRQADQNRMISQQLDAERAAQQRARSDAAAQADRDRFMREFNSGGATSSLGIPSVGVHSMSMPNMSGMNCSVGSGQHAGSIVCH